MSDIMRIRGTDYEVGPDIDITLTGREQLIIAEALAGLLARSTIDEFTEVMHVMQRVTGCREPYPRPA